MKVKTLQSIFRTKMHLFILNYKMVSIQLYSGKHSKTFLQIIFKTVRKTKRLYFATCKVKLFLLNVVVVLMFSTNTNVFDLTEFQQTEDSRNIWTRDISPQIFLHTKLQNKEVKRMTSVISSLYQTPQTCKVDLCFFSSKIQIQCQTIPIENFHDKQPWLATRWAVARNIQV